MLARLFSAGEQQDCGATGEDVRCAARLAARFAAKEAALKALGTGLSAGIAWTEVCVVSLPTGEPTLRVTGRAAEVATAKGITAWHVSLSHTKDHAMASVIAAGD